jgi:uncharacterized protein YndB with AHSA1/START domain
MRKTLLALLAAPAFLLSTTAAAEAEYVTIELETDVARPAEQVWSKVGDYCAISAWLSIDCTITEGKGGIGTVRSLANGRITEVMVAQTPLAYGYTMPAVQGEFHNLYHGFLEARPMGDGNTRLLYTLILDVSNLADQAAKDADIARRRATFERALGNMKTMAEQ